ncbi:GNAT family N-acetyltransferase [Erwinia sp. P6884]|uniref:GNAT family N-acetyltransferase n=1 Tax=Erwinia sp. P6884 TaxID=3141450 RepID=UPI003198A8FE
MISIEKSNPLLPESQALIEQLSAELAGITGDNGKRHFDSAEMRSGRALWVVARDKNGAAIGCGGLRPLSQEIAELKRMFSVRSLPGIGTALVNFLENSARALGYSEIWLETRRINIGAVAFYQKQGYREIANYGPYVGWEEAICFCKKLDRDA